MNSERTIITFDALRNYATCQRRTWLDQHGEANLRNVETTDADVNLGITAESHSHSIYSVNDGHLQRADVDSWEHGVAITRDLMARPVDTILGGHLELTTPLDLTDQLFTLRCRVDRLQRTSHLDSDLYSPIVIKEHGYPENADWLHLDLCVWLLQATQSSASPAELWLGLTADGQPRQRIPHDYNEDRLLAALTQVAETLNASDEPPVRLAPHCKTCHWYTACQATAQQAGSLDLLYRVSGKTRQQMYLAGLTSLAEVATSSLEVLRQVKGIGPATAPSIRANAQAWLEKRPVQYNPLTVPAPPEDAWMFDLETLEVGDRTLPWCLGWCDPQGATQVVLVAPVDAAEQRVLPDDQRITLAPDYETLWWVFADAMAANPAPIYHWTGYDIGILRSTAPGGVKQQLEPRMHDLHRLFTRSVSLPLKSTSIKAVSVYLGFEWIGTNDWFQAFLDYKQWIEADDLAALTRACMYQRADVQSMAWVWRWLAANVLGN